MRSTVLRCLRAGEAPFSCFQFTNFVSRLHRVLDPRRWLLNQNAERREHSTLLGLSSTAPPFRSQRQDRISYLFCYTYSYLTPDSGGFNPALESAARRPLPFSDVPAPESFEWAQGMCSFTSSKTSCANNFVGSVAEVSFHCLRPRIPKAARAKNPKAVAQIIKVRGGNDFFSGTNAVSSTLTLGVSLASCTFANSYCCVSVS